MEGRNFQTWGLIILVSISREESGGASLIDEDTRCFFIALVEAGPSGNRALQELLQWGHASRFIRVRESLIALGAVKRIRGGRGGRLIPLVESLDQVESHLETTASRERSLYAPLEPQVRRMVMEHHQMSDDQDDEITIFITADQGSRKTGGRMTRPDLTVLVQRDFGFGNWIDVHGIEVKPYWSIGRDGLYEAAAQMAMQRCSHSWLLVYAPGENVAIGPDERDKVNQAQELISGQLNEEALDMGLGLAVSDSLSVDLILKPLANPRRTVMDPDQLANLWESIEFSE
jgi:hypothetical protein